MLVLIADDEPETCTLVAAILASAGHTCVEARDAMQVMFMAMHRKPDLIILDLLMPAGTGAGAMQKLKASKLTAHIPVVVLSGSHDRELIDRVMALGAVAFLPKPVDADELLAAVASTAAPASPSA
jgi:two-component system, chemotaxis family, response regulator PixG